MGKRKGAREREGKEGAASWHADGAPGGHLGGPGSKQEVASVLQGASTHELPVTHEEDMPIYKNSPSFGRFPREKQNSTSFGIIQYLVFV
jgi:hypothetical protein